MDNIVVRTDLAVEANEEAMNGTGKLRGIRLRESNKSRMGVKVTECSDKSFGRSHDRKTQRNLSYYRGR
ncbi:MAG: hypothetical protein ACLRMX_11730 [Lachnospira eligens]